MPERPRTHLERTPDGLRLVLSRSMQAGRAAVWRAFRDTRRWPEWAPPVTDVDCTDRFVERGSTGHVTMLGGPRLPFEVTACADGRWAWELAPLPTTGHRVRTDDAGGTVAAFEIPLTGTPHAFVNREALRRLDRVARRDEGE